MDSAGVIGPSHCQMGNRLRPLIASANFPLQRATKPPGKEGLVAVKVHMTARTSSGQPARSRCHRQTYIGAASTLEAPTVAMRYLLYAAAPWAGVDCPVMTSPVISWISVESFGYAENAGRK